MKKIEIREYIMMRSKFGIEPFKIHSELVSCLRDSAPSIKTVYRWVERLQTSGESPEDRHDWTTNYRMLSEQY